MKNKVLIRLLINIIFLVAVLIFSALYASRLDWTLLAELHVSIVLLALSICVGVVFLLLSAFIL